MDALLSPETWISLLTLTVLEIVLGIDNIVFIAILSGRLPESQQAKARQLGLSLALITRILLLMTLMWLAHLTTPLFHLPTLGLLPTSPAVSGRDLILLAGGLFLIWKATHEIHDRLEGAAEDIKRGPVPSFAGVIVQILLLDIVFSLDSVITAVGMARQLSVMIAAVVIAVIFMLFFAGQISGFIHRHPTLKMLALSFLLLIGFTLTLEAFHYEVPKGYIYFAMAFSVGVEVLNLRMQAKARPKPVHLRDPFR